jgi:hypothetical protein
MRGCALLAGHDGMDAKLQFDLLSYTAFRLASPGGPEAVLYIYNKNIFLVDAPSRCIYSDCARCPLTQARPLALAHHAHGAWDRCCAQTSSGTTNKQPSHHNGSRS